MPYFLHRFLSNCLLGAMFMINAIQDLIEEFDSMEKKVSSALYEYLEYVYIGLEDVLVEELGWEVKDEI